MPAIQPPQAFSRGDPETSGHGPKPAGPQASTAQTTTPDTGRDARGRFQPGNPGGPGNPFSRRVAALRQALLNAVTPEDLQGIVAAMLERAKQGDVAAARLVLAYAVGKPTPAVDPDSLDLQEWQHWQQMPVATEDVRGLLGHLQAPQACVLARVLLPLVQQNLARELAQGLDPKPAPSSPEPARTEPRAAAQEEANAVKGGPVEQPTSIPAAPPPVGRANSQDKTRQQDGSKPSRGAARRTTESCSPKTPGGETAEPKDPKGELNRWLQWLDPSVFLDSSP